MRVKINQIIFTPCFILLLNCFWQLLHPVAVGFLFLSICALHTSLVSVLKAQISVSAPAKRRVFVEGRAGSRELKPCNTVVMT